MYGSVGISRLTGYYTNLQSSLSREQWYISTYPFRFETNVGELLVVVVLVTVRLE